MKIFHIITSIDYGGSQNILFNICKKDLNNEHLVISLKNLYKYRDTHNVKVYSFNTNLFNFPFVIFKILKLIFYFNPNVIQSWLYHADFITIFIKPFLPKRKIIWNIRSTNLSLNKNFFTIIVRTINSLFSYIVPNKIIFCSNESLDIHKKYLFNKNIFYLIHNGVDLDYYKILNKNNNSDCINIGCNARYHPMKDHLTLFKALSLLKKKNIIFKLHLIGEGINDINFKQLDFFEDIIIYKLGSDTNDFFNQIDLHILPSIYGESFSNVLLESMSCGVFNLATDVGNNKKILQNYVKIFKIKDSNDLYLKILDYKISRKTYSSMEFKQNQRNYIFKNFSLKNMLINYNNIWS